MIDFGFLELKADTVRVSDLAPDSCVKVGQRYTYIRGGLLRRTRDALIDDEWEE